MQVIHDSHGIPYTASNYESVHQATRLVDHYMGYRRDIGDQLKLLLEMDPEMPMAMCIKGYFGKMMGSAAHSARAQSMLAKIKDRHSSDTTTDREWLHVQALESWCGGDTEGAAGFWEEILTGYPTDAIALRLAHFNHFYSGDASRIRDSMHRVMPSWSVDHPYYGYVLGMYAFGLEECGEYEQAERYGRQAVEINPSDAWSVHAVAHVMEMQERHEEGVTWITELEDQWSIVNNFRFHLYWHRCLFQLEMGDYDSVFTNYDAFVASDLEAGFYLDICNAASLLWRLELHGMDVGNRWRALSEIARDHVQDRDLIFVTLHYFMASLADKESDSKSLFLDNMEEWALDGSSQGKVAEVCGRKIALALSAAREGDHGTCYSLLADCHDVVNLIGGSHAQRDLFSMIMLHAGMHSPNIEDVISKIERRVSEKPKSPWAKQLLAQS